MPHFDKLNNAVVVFSHYLLDAFAAQLKKELPEAQAAAVDAELTKFKTELKDEAAAAKKKGRRAAKSQEGGEAKPARPRSAYTEFMSLKMKELSASRAGVPRTQLMKEVAQLWREQKGGAAAAPATPSVTAAPAPKAESKPAAAPKAEAKPAAAAAKKK